MQIHEPRSQLDHMLRQTRNNLIAFSQMADTKAHILLSISSVALSLSFTKISDRSFTRPLVGLEFFLLLTIYLALLTVIGKVKVLNRRKHSTEDPDYSPLFFGSYGDISYSEYTSHFEGIMNDPDKTHEVIVRDIYHAGRYLLHTKYRYIRLACLFFFTGLLVGIAMFILQSGV